MRRAAINLRGHFGSLQRSITRRALLSVDPVRCDLIWPSLLHRSEYELLLPSLLVEPPSSLASFFFSFFVSVFSIPPCIWIRPPPAAPHHPFWEQMNGLGVLIRTQQTLDFGQLPFVSLYKGCAALKLTRRALFMVLSHCIIWRLDFAVNVHQGQ